MAAVSDIGRPLRADAARNRARIVATARETFAEKGVAVGVDEIARRAGVGMGTLYRRFPTKEALVLAIFDERLDALVVLAEGGAPLKPLAALERFMARACEQMSEDHGLLQMLAEHLQRRSGPEILELRRRYLAILEPVVTRAREAGVVRADLDEHDVAVLLRMLAAADPAERGGAPALGRGRAHYLEIVLAGLRP